MTPIKQRAAIVTENGIVFGLADVPKPGPGQILVKVVAAAQNPVDRECPLCAHTFSCLARGIAFPVKILEIAFKAAKYGGILGRDFAGVVEELGPDVPEGVRTVGERVAGMMRDSQFSIFSPPPSTSSVVAGLLC